ncbi:vWA domain-containing protein [Catellatospora paridis]|uniref:VWA domain-containing protein n=1 Tax=Catellatospora paridis TaxID=1617086 RepID=UPI0012D3926F|nr:VWA domain-containing protein [Catellatospora paridis]
MNLADLATLLNSHSHGPRITSQHPAWEDWSKAFTAHIPTLTGLTGLSVVVTPGGGAGAPGCHFPHLHRIEIDADIIKVPPFAANPHSKKIKERQLYAAAYGVLIHEGAHALHSRWNPPPDTPDLLAEIAMMLEESRAEALHRNRRPRDGRWLRAAAAELIMPNFATTASAWDAGVAAALLLTRADAKILRQRDVRHLRNAIVAIIGTKRLRRLRDIWRQAHQCADTDATTMIDLARQWLEVLDIDPDSPDPTDSAPYSPTLPAAIAGALTSATRLPVKTPPPPPDPRHKAAGRVFGRTKVTWTTRPPTPQERTAAHQLRQQLVKASTRDKTVTPIRRPTPPGRLMVRAALAADAARAHGQQINAEPFRANKTRKPPVPPLRVGIAVDVSDSMSGFAPQVSSLAWIIAQASHSLDAKTATVAFGPTVQPLTRPGQAHPAVQELDPGGGTSYFDQAVLALDGALGLSGKGAARLLVIISDGDIPDLRAVKLALHRITRAGAALLWLTPPGTTLPISGQNQIQVTDPAQCIAIVGQAAVDAWAKA